MHKTSVVDKAPPQIPQCRGTQSHGILQFVLHSFRLHSILLTEGSILRDLGIASMGVTPRTESRAKGLGGYQLPMPLHKTLFCFLQERSVGATLGAF